MPAVQGDSLIENEHSVSHPDDPAAITHISAPSSHSSTFLRMLALPVIPKLLNTTSGGENTEHHSRNALTMYITTTTNVQIEGISEEWRLLGCYAVWFL
jgi:cytochrome b561